MSIHQKIPEESISLNFDQNTWKVIMNEGKVKAANSSIFSLQKLIMPSLFFLKQYFS